MEPSLTTVHASIDGMRTELDRLAGAIERLARLEERNIAMASTVSELKSITSAIDNRLKTLETAAPTNRRLSTMVDRGTWAAIGVLCMMILKQIGAL